jgi:transposase
MKNRLREEARELFVEQGFSVDTIQKVLEGNVSRKTIYNWKKEDGWEDDRRWHLKKTENLKDDIYELARMAVQEAKTNFNARTLFAVAKIFGVLKQLQSVTLPGEETGDKKPKGITEDTISEIEKLLGV